MLSCGRARAQGGFFELEKITKKEGNFCPRSKLVDGLLAGSEGPPPPAGARASAPPLGLDAAWLVWLRVGSCLPRTYAASCAALERSPGPRPGIRTGASDAALRSDVIEEAIIILL